MVETKQAIKELTLMLMYLTSMTENSPIDHESVYYAWKGYDFDVLNQLADEDLIYLGKHPSRRKSVVLYDEAVEQAKELLEKYGIKDWEDNE